MRTLLIPLDGSDFAEEVLSEGLTLFGQEKLHLILLRCVDLNEPVKYTEEFILETHLEKERHRQIEGSFGAYLERHAEPLRKQGHQVETMIRTGSPVELILHVSEESHPDAILLKSHGRSGIKRLFLGSVAEGVARRAACTVVLLPASKSN